MGGGRKTGSFGCYQFRGEKILRDLRGGGVGEHLFIKQVFSLEEKGLYGILGVKGGGGGGDTCSLSKYLV